MKTLLVTFSFILCLIYPFRSYAEYGDLDVQISAPEMKNQHLSLISGNTTLSITLDQDGQGAQLFGFDPNKQVSQVTLQLKFDTGLKLVCKYIDLFSPDKKEYLSKLLLKTFKIRDQFGCDVQYLAYEPIKKK